jgi:hypothetical protein
MLVNNKIKGLGTRDSGLKTILAFCLLSSIFSLSAQQLNYTLNRDYSYGYDNYYNSKENNFQTFVKPYRFVDLKQVKDSSLAFPSLKKTYGQLSKTEKFKLTAYPLLTAGAGFQATPTSRFTNDLAIGANIMGDIGSKFSFNIKALAGKAQFNSYTDSVINQTNVIPGVGTAYLLNNNPANKIYSYQYYSGYISYSPNKIFNFQLGRDKHFFGDGYRSLFLSDATAPYPFFKITTNVWKFNYVNLSTVMKDASNSSNLKKDWATKYATFHYLGINVSKRINIGLFESIVWQGTDSVRYRGYDVNYMNPFVFFRPIEYSLGSSDNSAVGLSFKIKMFTKQQLYGQLFLDDFSLKEILQRNGFWQNKEAVQVGFKSFDVFKVKQLYFQTEFNYAKPYTYSHGSVLQNYSHLNQPLAHPLGGNFMESATFVNYRHKRMLFEVKCIYAIYGADSLGQDYGKNIFISYHKHPHDFDNHIGQGIRTNLITASLRAAYIVDPKMNFKIELGLVYRVEQTAIYTKDTPYIFIGVKTDLCNLYSDY